MNPIHKQILAIVGRPGYQPLKPKMFYRKLAIPGVDYEEFKEGLKDLLRKKQIHLSKSHSILPVPAVQQHALTGTFRKTTSGHGFVRPPGVEKAGEIYIPEERIGDAVTGDIVQVKITRQTPKGPRGEILSVIERVTRQFVGTYFIRDDQAYVRVDGAVFAHSVYVGDPGVKGAKHDDKVVLEMIRFPSSEDRGEGVITEVLGRRGQPGVDTLSIIRALGLPEEFAEDTLHEARLAAAEFSEENLQGREDLTGWTTITIDPVDAKDFDDAISLSQDPKSKHWQLGVHIADVGHFAVPGGALDREARKRGTSVYLPQKVIPMFPEIVSNGLASLQQGRVRFVKSVLLDLTPQGQIAHVRFTNSAIRVKRRFAYEQVMELLGEDKAVEEPKATAEEPSKPVKPTRARKGAKAKSGGDEEHSVQALYPRPKKTGRKAKSAEDAPPVAASDADVAPTPSPEPVVENRKPAQQVTPPANLNIEPEIVELVHRMRDLALILHKRRVKRGALELNMPQVVLEYDENGRVVGGHFYKHDISHQMIEEFMLMANEAVAAHLDSKDIYLLRRVHPAPDPAKLKSFAGFAGILGYKTKGEVDRYSLQRILQQSAKQPEVHAVHYALLRSLKQAHYSPEKEEHYALASENYCHFTSPIRRYPDLVVHRLLDQVIKRGRAGSSYDELLATGEHCSKMERRAEMAERELVKLRLLTYMSTKLGMEMEVVITGVADYGFFGQAQTLPVEGMVHVSTLPDDYYNFDEDSHSLVGQRTGRRFRLGDKVNAQVVRVDLQRRQLDFRIVGTNPRQEQRTEKREEKPRKDGRSKEGKSKSRQGKQRR